MTGPTWKVVRHTGLDMVTTVTVVRYERGAEVLRQLSEELGRRVYARDLPLGRPTRMDGNA